MKKLSIYVTVALFLACMPLILIVPSHVAFASEGLPTIKLQMTGIEHDAKELQHQVWQIEDGCRQIEENETDPKVLDSAKQIASFAQQIDQNSGLIIEIANEINYRIDHSEGTILQLSIDIGEMADRILWTERQIGVMADRILESEYIIANTSILMAQDILVLSGQMEDTTNHILDLVAQIVT